MGNCQTGLEEDQSDPNIHPVQLTQKDIQKKNSKDKLDEDNHQTVTEKETKISKQPSDEEIEVIKRKGHKQPLKGSQTQSQNQQLIQLKNDSTFDILNQEQFYVITCIFSPFDTQEKVKKYKEFAQKMNQQGFKLITIEFTTQGYPFIVTDEFFEPFNLQKRVECPIFLKYNFLLVNEWSWLAVIDYNVDLPEGWSDLAIQELRKSQIIQLYDKVQIQDYYGNIIDEKDGIYEHLQEDLSLEEFDQKYEFGGAWAFRRDIFTNLNGIIDCFVTGKEELFISLCLMQKCAKLCESFLAPQVIDYLKKIEIEYKQLNISLGKISQTIIIQQILKKKLQIQQIVELMNPIFANLSKNSEDLFEISNKETKQKLEELKDLIL